MDSFNWKSCLYSERECVGGVYAYMCVNINVPEHSVNL